jgi:hypothetical protein
VIDYDAEPESEPRIDTGPGWRRTTPVAKNQSRFYEDTAPGDDRWPATDARFTSVTEALRAAWPSDWTGPAKSNVAKGVWENAADIATWRAQYDQAVREAQS